MLTPPVDDKKRALARATAEIFLAKIPVFGDALVRLYQETFPPAFQAQLETWRRDVSDKVNGHDAVLNALTDRLQPTLIISEAATAVAISMCRLSAKGLPSPIPFDDILAMTPEFNRLDVDHAIYELAELAFVTTKHQHLSIRPTLDLFRAFDPAALGTNPEADAKLLARAVLDTPAFSNVHVLDVHMAWPRRRFNPALAVMLTFVNHMSQELQDDYPTTSFILDGPATVKLKRFACG